MSTSTTHFQSRCCCRNRPGATIQHRNRFTTAMPEQTTIHSCTGTQIMEATARTNKACQINLAQSFNTETDSQQQCLNKQPYNHALELTLCKPQPEQTKHATSSMNNPTNSKAFADISLSTKQSMRCVFVSDISLSATVTALTSPHRVC